MAGEGTPRSLDIADLRLLMDNYQNIVQMSTILLEQQKQVIDLQKDMLHKQDDISKQQYDVINKIGFVVDRLDTCAENLSKANDIAGGMHTELIKSITDRANTAEDKLEAMHLDNAKDHRSIVNKIYIAWGATGTAVLSLVGLLVIVFNKYSIISDIHDMVHQIMLNFTG